VERLQRAHLLHSLLLLCSPPSPHFPVRSNVSIETVCFWPELQPCNLGSQKCNKKKNSSPITRKLLWPHTREKCRPEETWDKIRFRWWCQSEQSWIASASIISRLLYSDSVTANDDTSGHVVHWLQVECHHHYCGLFLHLLPNTMLPSLVALPRSPSNVPRRLTAGFLSNRKDIKVWGGRNVWAAPTFTTANRCYLLSSTSTRGEVYKWSLMQYFDVTLYNYTHTRGCQAAWKRRANRLSLTFFQGLLSCMAASHRVEAVRSAALRPISLVPNEWKACIVT